MTASRSDRRDHGPAHCAACPARPAPRRHRFRPGGVESLEDRQLMAASPLAELGAGGHRVHDVHVHGATPGDVTLPGGTTSEQVFYNTSGISIQPVTAWQGIVASGTAGQYFITGTSLHRVREVGLLYEGPISGEGGTTYAVNYPAPPTRASTASPTSAGTVSGWSAATGGAATSRASSSRGRPRASPTSTITGPSMIRIRSTRSCTAR